mmetsp:Transcript_31883/g.101711  ORF Transcript_31883/g.101711 Transcript_31883/m.101711 type:complete len:212 (+) Transcript_31883:46-681(+)
MFCILGRQHREPSLHQGCDPLSLHLPRPALSFLDLKEREDGLLHLLLPTMGLNAGADVVGLSHIEEAKAGPGQVNMRAPLRIRMRFRALVNDRDLHILRPPLLLLDQVPQHRDRFLQAALILCSGSLLPPPPSSPSHLLLRLLHVLVWFILFFHHFLPFFPLPFALCKEYLRHLLRLLLLLRFLLLLLLLVQTEVCYLLLQPRLLPLHAPL